MPQKLQPRGISLAGLGHPGDGLCSTVARPSSRCSSRQGEKQAEVRQKQAGQEVSAWSGRESIVWLAARKRDLGEAKQARSRPLCPPWA